MTVSSAYLDTSPFIYLVEGHPRFAPAVVSFVQQCVADNTSLSTSVLTIMEFGVKPLQLGRTDLVQIFDELLRELRFEVQPITREIAFSAAQLRASYPFLKSLDALHLAAAQASPTMHTRPIPQSNEPLPVVGIGTWQAFDTPARAVWTRDASLGRSWAACLGTPAAKRQSAPRASMVEMCGRVGVRAVSRTV